MNNFICVSCQVSKVRNPSEKGSSGQIVKRDEEGRRWNGRRCPDCVSAYVMSRPRSKKAAVSQSKRRELNRAVEEDLGPKMDMDPITNRPCRKCNKKLRQSCYFLCDTCKPPEHFSEGQGMYGSEDWGYASLRPLKERTDFKVSELCMMGGA